MFGRAGFPAPNEPAGEDLDRINSAWKALLAQQDPSLKDVLANHPAWQPVRPTPFQPPQLNADGDPPNTWQLIAAGWGFVLLDPASVQADNGAGLTRGIIGLVNKGSRASPRTGAHCAPGAGRRTRSGLSRDRPRSRCKTCRYRRCFALRQSGLGHYGVRSAFRDGSSRFIRKRRGHTFTPQLRRGS